MKKPEFIEVEVTFSICIPHTSKKNAIRLMNEAIGNINNELDNAESLFDSYDEIFRTDIEEDEKGYSYGFDKPRIVLSKTLN